MGWAAARTGTSTSVKAAIGLSGFAHILNDARFAGVPMILETPKSDDMHEDVENLAVLRGVGQNLKAMRCTARR